MFTFSQIRIGVCALAIVLASVGCSNEASESALPTHTHEALEDAQTNGVLAGRADCLWLEHDGGNRRPLVFPQGVSGVQDGQDIVLLDDQGEVIARTGDYVFVGGAADSSAPSCIEGAEAVDPWLVSNVEVCSSDDCLE